MAGNFEVDIQGDVKAVARLRGMGKPDQMRKLVEDAAKAAASKMYVEAPVGKTGGLKRRIDWSHAFFHPGGAGGGGYWEAHAGVTAGDPYPTHVFHGTGIYGPTGERIKPATGNVMVLYGLEKSREFDFSKNNVVLGKPRIGPIYTRSIKGQRPQQHWVEAGQDTADWYVKTYYHRIFERTN